LAEIRCVGELDLAGTDELAQAVEKCIRLSNGIVNIDCRDVTFIDCAGLRAMSGAVDRCRRSGMDVHVQLSAAVRRVSDLLDLTGRLEGKSVSSSPNRVGTGGR
jgi:anti-anti-sigma factor